MALSGWWDRTSKRLENQPKRNKLKVECELRTNGCKGSIWNSGRPLTNYNYKSPIFPLLEMADNVLHFWETLFYSDLLCFLSPPFPFLSHSDKSDKTIWKTVQSFPSLDWQTPCLEKSTIRNSYNIYFQWIISKSSMPCFKMFIIIQIPKSNL